MKSENKRLVVIGAVNGAILGGGLALAHSTLWLPLGLGIAVFITATFAFARRWAAKP